ncbi:hypothetical protein RHSIM_Rhsim05G0142800 [Rhododendron simsii]|uniref:DDE Tnp4 domain-containing protein n=1 Tax=Rhododendron simsii TaxID=118357 RepID=A0A834H9E7_RHOSS|nr:hypothetical protein RHSIM_Rhsim05G0142800 [Rhododendron simsii]
MLSDKQKSALKIIALILIIKILRKKRIGRRPDTDSMLTGPRYMKELVTGNPAHCQEMLRMKIEAFISMCHHFRIRGWLQNSRYISVEEKVAMFLIALSHNIRNRFVKRRFNHSTQTIHRYFYEVLHAMLNFSKEMIVDTPYDQPAHQIRENRRIRHIFQGAVGALDGTLISAVVPRDQQIPYRGRGRGECYQNVLAICDFDMLFTFVWAGWEGVAHDSRVLRETMNDPANNFPILPPGKYFLCDAAYTHTRRFMAPYRNVRYWLADFQNGRRPRNKEERFNLAHARLRNVIERAFGVLKSRFPILKRMSSYPFAVQRNMVIACITMHNFIRRTCISDQFLDKFNDPNASYDNAQHHVDNFEVGGGSTQADQIFMLTLREQIATQLNAINYS